jgi:hypothetical protein
MLFNQYADVEFTSRAYSLALARVTRVAPWFAVISVLSRCSSSAAPPEIEDSCGEKAALR